MPWVAWCQYSPTGNQSINIATGTARGLRYIINVFHLFSFRVNGCVYLRNIVTLANFINTNLQVSKNIYAAKEKFLPELKSGA